MPRRYLLWLALPLALLGCVAASLAQADCPMLTPSGLPLNPNVSWTPTGDSIVVCPAGDSVFVFSDLHTRRFPSRLKFLVTYYDNDCNPRTGVPPESIYVSYRTVSGNACVNDEGLHVYADDATDVNGQARISIPSISGCGKLRFDLGVNGTDEGSRYTTVRSLDGNADGRASGADGFPGQYCDLNYSGGTPDTADFNVGYPHWANAHWHRNVVFGTPVQRTSLGMSTYGDGNIDWEPNQIRIAFSHHFPDSSSNCKIFLVSASPAAVDTISQFTFAPAESDSDDYDPSWSPRGNEITWDRNDLAILRRAVPNDTTTVDPNYYTVFRAAFTGADRVTEGQISPNGRNVAFVQYKHIIGQPQRANIYVVPITGGTAKQITAGTDIQDKKPTWSPDGKYVYYTHTPLGGGSVELRRVPSDSGTALTIWSYGGVDSLFEPQVPHASPDGAIISFSRYQTAPAGLKSLVTLDATTVAPPLEERQLGPFAAGRTSLYSAVSPDGTRMAFVAAPGEPVWGREQLWCVRRNMDSPPILQAIGDQVITAGDSITIVPTGSDPEGSTLTYHAAFLPPGATFTTSGGSHRFAWRSALADQGKSYWVKFWVTEWNGSTTAEGLGSGATASTVVKISVIAPGARYQIAGSPTGLLREGGNPSRGPFVLRTPPRAGERVSMRVYDASGRLVKNVEGPTGSPLVWDGKFASGRQAAPGVYLYRAALGSMVRTGKWVLVH